MQNTVAELGYTMATPIQAGSLPFALAGRDVIGQAQTGSGKTAAFGIPIIERLDPRDGPVQALVLCPTRELAVQVHEELVRLGKRHELRSVAIYGGDSIGRQMEELRQGAHIVVATPGRLGDHIQRRSLTLANVRVCVLDEADRMLDMGFAPDVERILRQCPAAASDAALQRHHARVGAQARAAPHARSGDRGDQHPPGDSRPRCGSSTCRRPGRTRPTRWRRSSISPMSSWR